MKALENAEGKGENAGNQRFLIFPVFSTLTKGEIAILVTLDMWSANAFNLVLCKILSFAKGLNPFHLNFIKLKSVFFKPNAGCQQG